MFGLLPYLWMAFMLAVVVAPTTLAVMHRPKKVRVKAGEPNVDGMGDGVPEEQQVLDFQLVRDYLNYLEQDYPNYLSMLKAYSVRRQVNFHQQLVFLYQVIFQE
jgi:hypothetical protein